MNDLIRRKDVEQMLIALGGCDASDEEAEGWDMAIDAALEGLRKIESTDGWIPCSEKLPDDCYDVEVTCRNGIKCEGYYMDAVKFLKESMRMCDCLDCSECELGGKNVIIPCKFNGRCMEYKEPEKLVEIVEEWSKQHPPKTRQSEFLKMFPNTRLVDDIIVIEPCDIDNKRCGDGSKWCDDHTGCKECTKDYWLTEVEECDTNS